jgi:Do/DeqQ family serine protease
MMPRLAAAALAFCVVATPGFAQTQRQVPTGPPAQFSYAPIVQRAAPAVVNVFATRAPQQRGNPLAEDPFFRRFFGGNGFGVPRDQAQRSLGSGVIVDGSGLIVTNNHVIEGMDEVKVVLADKREFEAEIVLRDPRTDLAVLRIEAPRDRLPVIDIVPSDDLEVGDIVFAIGNPFGVGQTTTHGIVSALARTQVGITDYQFFIQTDAAINPGNSGGALVDIQGRLIGINTAIFSRSGGSMGIGFAIPASMVRVVVASARGGNAQVRRPWLGARTQRLTPDIAEGLGLQRPAGALVQSVQPGSAAARAGLRREDVVVAFDGQAIEDPQSLNFRLGTRPLGGRAELTVLRQGREVKLTLPLEGAPETTPREAQKVATRSPFAGATVANLSPALAEELRADLPDDGVVVTAVDVGSSAQRFGLRPGDIVIGINGESVRRAGDVERLTRDGSRVWRIQINRNGQVINSVVGG